MKLLASFNFRVVYACARFVGVKQTGQAMTEFVVVAATVLVPLFLILPILGKYGDMNITAPQAARYVVWERTVWHNSNDYESNGVDTSTNYPEKAPATIAYEAKQRFMQDPMVDLTSSGYTQNPFWVDNNQNELVETIQVTPPDMSETPSFLNFPGTSIGPYDFFEGVSAAIDVMYGTVRDWFNGSAGFTPNFDGRYGDTGGNIISMPIENPDYIVSQVFGQDQMGLDETIEDVDIAFTANAGVLTNTWTTQSGSHFENQVGGLIPLGIFQTNGDSSVIGDILDLASGLLLEPKLAADDDPESLNLGGFNTDPFALEYENGSDDFCDGDGLCSFDP